MGPAPRTLHPVAPGYHSWERDLLLGTVLPGGLTAMLGSCCPSNNSGDSDELGDRSVCREMGWDEPKDARWDALPRAAVIGIISLPQSVLRPNGL